GRIEVEPAEAWAEDRAPGVRSLGANRILAAAQIAADVPGGESQRPETRNHEMREILANAAAGFQHLRDRRRDGRSPFIVAEVLEDAVTQIESRFGDRTLGHKRRRGIGGQLRSHLHQRRAEGKLQSPESFVIVSTVHLLARLFPSRCGAFVRWFLGMEVHLAERGY